MKLTLLDDQGGELTEITSHTARSRGHMLVAWATRPDALFQYYFDRGSRTVTAVIGAAHWSAVLGTRWQMGARVWFLREFKLIHAAADAVAHAASMHDSVSSDESPEAPIAVLDVLGSAAEFDPQGVPT